MTLDTPRIDPYLFECQLEAFRKFVEEKSSSPFVSFESNRYIEEHEKYKSKSTMPVETRSRFSHGRDHLLEAERSLRQ